LRVGYPMSLEHSPARQGVQLRPDADRLLSFQECADDLGVHRTTFYRAVLPYLEVVEISAQRRGVRESVFEAFKRSRTRPPARKSDAG
jgi:hypothetical protein